MWLKYNSQKKIDSRNYWERGRRQGGRGVRKRMLPPGNNYSTLCSVFSRQFLQWGVKIITHRLKAQTTLHSTELPRSQTGWQNTQRGALKRTLYCRSLAREMFLFSPWSVVQWVRSGLEGLEALHAMRPHNLSRLVSSGRGHSDNPANLLCHHHHHILQLPSTSGSTKCRSWRNIMETIVSHTFIVVYDEARGSLLVVLCRRV